MKREDTETLEDRELNQARSKPAPVDRPPRTENCASIQYCRQYCSTETALLTFCPSRTTAPLRCGQVDVTG